jgi:hypothetical protein
MDSDGVDLSKPTTTGGALAYSDVFSASRLGQSGVVVDDLSI